MADEIKFKISTQFEKGEILHRYASKEFVIDASGSNPFDNTQAIGTSAENVAMGDAGAGAWVMAENTDATNYVELGYDSGGFVAFMKIPAASPCLPFKLASGITLQAKANTGACNVRFIIYPA